VPVVLWAGALPGLPGILAEALVRRLPTIRRLRIASTGAFAETETARRDLQALATLASDGSARGALARWLPELWRFAEPIGTRPVAPSFSPDLDGFAESHCVDELVYLEPPRGLIVRSLGRLVAQSPDARFGLAALASCDPDPRAEPTAGIELFAPNAVLPAAALAGILTAAILSGGGVPAGLSTPREALNPAFALTELEKRSVRISAASR